MVADSIATAAEAGIQTANQHRGIIILAAAKVRDTHTQHKEKQKHSHNKLILHPMFGFHCYYFSLAFFFEKVKME